MSKIKWFLIHQLRRTAHYLEYGKDDYGKPGFDKLMYQGKEAEPNKD